MEDFVADEQVWANLSVAEGRSGFGQQPSCDQCRTPLHVIINQSLITFVLIIMFQLMAPWTLVILWKRSHCSLLWITLHCWCLVLGITKDNESVWYAHDIAGETCIMYWYYLSREERIPPGCWQHTRLVSKKNITFRAPTHKHSIQYMTAVTVYNIIKEI